MAWYVTLQIQNNGLLIYPMSVNKLVRITIRPSKYSNYQTGPLACNDPLPVFDIVCVVAVVYTVLLHFALLIDY